MGFNTANISHRQGYINARHIGARSSECSDHSGTRIGCATNNLNGGSIALVDCQDAKFICIRVLLCRQNLGNSKWLKGCAIIDVFNLKTNHCELLDNFIEGGICFQMVFEP